MEVTFHHYNYVIIEISFEFLYVTTNPLLQGDKLEHCITFSAKSCSDKVISNYSNKVSAEKYKTAGNRTVQNKYNTYIYISN